MIQMLKYAFKLQLDIWPDDPQFGITWISHNTRKLLLIDLISAE